MTKSPLKQATISVRIDPAIKAAAIDNLAKAGLSLSDYARIVITAAARDGVPKYFGMPNTQVLAAIDEMIADKSGKKKMASASSVEDLKNQLFGDDDENN